MNQIRKVLQTRIENLIQLAEVAGEVTHSSTIGDLRESYLRNFFQELIPNSVSLNSGFVGDAIGNISPQLDFVVTQNSALPVISMKDQLSIVPVESALLVAEIKSNLKTNDLEQVQKQNDSLTSLQISCNAGSNDLIIPTIILAYESDIANKTLKEWMRKNGNTVACCILNGDTILRNDNLSIIKKNSSKIRHYGVLNFISTFYDMLIFLNKQRDISPDFHFYLTASPKQDKRSS